MGVLPGGPGQGKLGRDTEARPECDLRTQSLPAGDSGMNLACVLRLRTFSTPSHTVCPPASPYLHTWVKQLQGLREALQGRHRCWWLGAEPRWARKRGCRNTCSDPRVSGQLQGPLPADRFRKASLRVMITPLIHFSNVSFCVLRIYYFRTRIKTKVKC